MSHLGHAAGLAGRAGRIAVLVSMVVARVIVLSLVTRHEARHGLVARELAGFAERAGGAFTKAGQLMATRPDLVGPVAAAWLGRLQDEVRPMTARQAARVIAARPELNWAAEALRRPPVASGCIASVYRVERDGADIALKVMRPGIGRRITADLAILGALARLLAILPRFRGLPIVEIVQDVAAAVAGQLDFGREAASLDRLRRNMADCAGTTVPRPMPELCSDLVIAMEYIDGLDRATIQTAPANVQEAAVEKLVHAVYHMVFVDGFLHIDLHQGNAYVRADGDVVILDMGYCHELSSMARYKFSAFFAGMIEGDGEGCADILLSTVRGGTGRADLASFRRQVAGLVLRSTGQAVNEFSLAKFSFELFELQRRHKLFAEPEFAFPLLALLAVEGTVRRYHPKLDFQLAAAPYVMRALLEASASGIQPHPAERVLHAREGRTRRIGYSCARRPREVTAGRSGPGRT